MSRAARFLVDRVDVRSLALIAIAGNRIGLQEPSCSSGTDFGGTSPTDRPKQIRGPICGRRLRLRKGAESSAPAAQSGYDSLVGERGQALVRRASWQRMSIARGWLIAPAHSILDEATSSVEPRRSAMSRKALDNLVAEAARRFATPTVEHPCAKAEYTVGAGALASKIVCKIGGTQE